MATRVRIPLGLLIVVAGQRSELTSDQERLRWLDEPGTFRGRQSPGRGRPIAQNLQVRPAPPGAAEMALS